MLTTNRIFIERSADVGVLPLDVGINYGVTGPSLRGSGSTFDLRKDEPYSVYDKVDFDVPVGQGLMGTVGDCWDRYYVKILEMKESAKILRQALDGIPKGDVHEVLPKKIPFNLSKTPSDTQNRLVTFPEPQKTTFLHYFYHQNTVYPQNRIFTTKKHCYPKYAHSTPKNTAPPLVSPSRRVSE